MLLGLIEKWHRRYHPKKFHANIPVDAKLESVPAGESIMTMEIKINHFF